MTSLAYADTNGALSLLDQQLKRERDNIRQARAYRRQYFDWRWQLNLAYAAGHHWLGWHEQTRTLRTIQELDPRYRGRELITSDVLTEYRTTALGELGSGNERPELLLARDDVTSEDFQAQLNRAVAYGWDNEWDGDSVMAQVDQYIVDLGTAAVRCRFDKNTGPVAIDNVPHHKGLPVMNPDQAMQLLQNGPNPDVTMAPVRAGKICWEPLSAFMLLNPPGATHERNFPWEAVIVPTYLPDVKAEFGAVAADLKEDNDISTTIGMQTSASSMNPSTYAVTDAAKTRLRDHVWLITYYERPTQQFAQGRTITFAGNDLKLMDYVETLPYQAPSGEWRAGLTYFHWWRVTGRFWSRALVDVLKDAQRTINKRDTQINEIIDRNMPFVVVEKGSLAKRRTGLVNEMVEIGPNEKPPQPVQGAAPGPWMQQSIEGAREALQHASGISGPRRGENPQNVTTYSQLALINELDAGKREPIYLERRRGIKTLIEDTVYDIRLYKGPQWNIALAGDDHQLEAVTFNATRIPTFMIVRVGQGDAKPRSQAAELQKITDMWNAVVLSGAVQQNPIVWLKWYKQSIDAGEMLELPADQIEDPGEKAEYENHYMMQGVAMPIAYYDVHAAHLPRHRRAQDQAMFAQDMATWQTIENHCQLHMKATQAQAEAQMAMQTPVGPSPGGLAAGPGQPSPPRAPGVASPPARRP